MSSPMAVTASPTSSDALPPYNRRDHSSLPVASVPNRCPGENDGRFEFRMVPPVGEGTDAISGHRKHRNSTSPTRKAGSQIPPIVRSRPKRPAVAGLGATTVGSSAPGTVAVSVGAAISHPGVEPGVQEIGDQIGDDHDQAEHEHRPLDHRQVA